MVSDDFLNHFLGSDENRTTSLGGKISGILAGFWDQFDNKAVFFGISVIAAFAVGILLFPLTNKLNKVVSEASGLSE